MELSRYVHLNPVRVARFGLGKPAAAERRAGLAPAASPEGIAARLAEFRWSSFRAYNRRRESCAAGISGK